MKYKKGSIVEVLAKDEFCNDFWRCAQIVSRNGHNYTVSYDVYPGFTDEEDVEHLSAKFIRPCPSMVEMSERWVPGDEVEVFHDLSWKMAIVLEDCSWNRYVVRVVGSLEELEVTKSELRARQTYQNGEWVDANCAKQRKYYGVLPKENAAILDFYLNDICFDAQNNDNLKESGIFSSKTRKRASPCFYTQDEENEERPLKFRVSGKQGRRLIVLGTSAEKVVDVINSKDMKEVINGINGSETDSVVSSSGSCSTNGYKPYDMHCRTGHDSDAESTCQSGYHEDTGLYHGDAEIYHGDADQSDTDEAWADEIHRQELDAYRSTLEAFYASGPLTWEKETMVTDLRLSLHISNDEHLFMLRNLISASSSCHDR
ncbi:EMSY domain-containing protein, Agenet domain [Artemisia annua]|uniref:EMSY domain-containing protein, Agenet domain n=1 Tax=Artemisia annua TaxID=35608 RepID=A0A2U1KRX2_ARTAN|nr:EMSY domain-containing protein, Agenet domain [Artemisia annua]